MTVRVVKQESPIIITKQVNQLVITTPGPQGPRGIGAGNLDYIEVDDDYVITLGSDVFVGVDCSDGNRLITLPLAISANKGAFVTIKKVDSTSYSVTVMTSNGQIIDRNSSSFVFDSFNDAFIFTSTGNSYKIS